MSFIEKIQNPTNLQREEISEIESQLIELCVLCSDPKIFNTAILTILTLNIYETLSKKERLDFLEELFEDMMNAFDVLDNQNEKKACF